MLDSLSPEQFDEWLAYREIEPDPYGRLIEIVKLGFAVLANCWGANISPEDIDPQRPATEESSPNQAAAFVRSKLGTPNGNRNR